MMDRLGREFVTELEREYSSKCLRQAVTSTDPEHQEWGLYFLDVIPRASKTFPVD
jgi:hypothetical protein